MFKKATKEQSKLRLAITGASGSGKTFSSLIIASSMGDKIAVVDTEHGSASLYSDKFNFDVMELKPPYEPERFIQAINMAEQDGYDVLIIDSLSHEWDGEGGYTELKTKLNDPYSAKVNPRHRKLVNCIIQSNLHIIATMRSKTAYEASKNEKNKLVLTKIGTAPVQKENMEYEFTTVFDIGQNHMASCSKDRTSLFDGKDFIIDASIGKQLMSWLTEGEPKKDKPKEPPIKPVSVQEKKKIIDTAKSRIDDQNSIEKLTEIKGTILDYLKSKNIDTLEIEEAFKIKEELLIKFANYGNEDVPQ